MKLIACDGRELKVYDLGPIVMRVSVRAGGPPIKLNGYRVMSDDDARATVRTILETGHYDSGRAG